MATEAEEYVGGVPIIVSLSKTDCTIMEEPPSLSYLLPRTTALMAIRDDVQKFFSPFIAAQVDTPLLVWFTYNNEPVPWQYPVGAIKDSIIALKLCEGSGADVPFLPDTVAALPSPAELNPHSFTVPLLLEARVTCVSSDKPLGVPCPGQEDNTACRNSEQTVRDYLKQIMKGTFSAMYGSIKGIMDARNEVINDMLNFALCTHMGEPLVQALRAHNERMTVLRRTVRNFSNVAVMINMPLANKFMHFALFRVPASTCMASQGGGSTLKGGDFRSSISSVEQSSGIVESVQIGQSVDGNDGGMGASNATVVADDCNVTFGEIIWRALLVPWCRRSKQAVPDGAPADPAAPFFQALSRFYEGMNDYVALGGVVSSSQAGVLIDKFISCSNAENDADGIYVTSSTAPTRRQRLGFVVQGTCPPLQTPVKYLLERFTSADGRLYVTFTVF
ncbi:uncharacterized protein TEOVI_000347000 [Trypanosoma equiperdum]|uniref:Autophagy protein ATG5 UblA domain-containing protein n=4 Tax=Trypanozoon TaxID=39700 RepID=Q584R3_TRYB2|nr:cysteine peptidase, putative [Trypanosoma brucei gambiense DAL972]XP_845364.1 hypothetical protein, conserved [Trypanosoma brucei brucei TREU927]AAX80875.1 hypothetical protein, conserved [Trypanosoma brucei]RHW72156.1 autophagy protein 5 [Trypanosoma brucei equiperdum]SCU71888.1 hypothetical protein, conserved [Trypanosoma equiperdum]AAZ11805.1 hypothetical protein, conserved [Trypanosoma brucei brucei TREU927]CBH11741.1 cysteine peptidase, putative [Trypanosoma brucei gambiense DAL972]|eukprot:XP_011774026.1 cysteine peptidase, putative [Trypanosoma brucei gambiense DAL972]